MANGFKINNEEHLLTSVLANKPIYLEIANEQWNKFVDDVTEDPSNPDFQNAKRSLDTLTYPVLEAQSRGYAEEEVPTWDGAGDELREVTPEDLGGPVAPAVEVGTPEARA